MCEAELKDKVVQQGLSGQGPQHGNEGDWLGCLAMAPSSVFACLCLQWLRGSGQPTGTSSGPDCVSSPYTSASPCHLEGRAGGHSTWIHRPSLLARACHGRVGGWLGGRPLSASGGMDCMPSPCTSASTSTCCLENHPGHGKIPGCVPCTCCLLCMHPGDTQPGWAWTKTEGAGPSLSLGRSHGPILADCRLDLACGPCV